MADVTVEASFANPFQCRANRAVVFVTEDVGYFFFIDGDQDLFYTKTTDGGATWGTPVEIDTDTTISAICFGIWYDQWTPGDSGTLVHIVWATTDLDDVSYRALDTSDDSLGSQVNVFVGATGVSDNGNFTSITKARGGNLYCAFDIDAGAERGFYRSTDGGASWASRDANLVEAADDVCWLYPANAADAQDIWAVYVDASAGQITVKTHDDSAGTTSESAAVISLTVNNLDGIQYQMSSSLRHSDGHLIITACNVYNNAANDHVVVDWDGSSATAKTNLVTNRAAHQNPAVFIDQTTDDIYVAYNGARTGAAETLGTTKVYYAVSTDGGTTWSDDTAYMEGAAGNVSSLWATPMGPRFFVGWKQDTTALIGNAVNSVTFGSGADNLTPSLFSDDDTFFAPTVGRGAVGLTPSLFTDGDTFHTPTATATYALTPSLFSDGDTFQAATVAAGAVDLAPSLFSDGDTFFAAAVAAGAVDLTPALYSDGDSFAQPAVSATYALTPALFAEGDTFHAPTVTAGAVDLAPELFAEGDTFFAASVSQAGASQEVSPALYSDGDTFFTATVAPGVVGLTPALYSDGEVFHAPTASATYSLMPALYAEGASFFAPTTTAIYALLAARHSDGDTFHAPAVEGGTPAASSGWHHIERRRRRR